MLWLLGDCRDQLLSIGDLWHGADLSRDLTDTWMLRAAVGCKTLTLTEGRRADPQLFAWISTMTPGGERDSLAIALPAARLAFPARGRPAARNVCDCLCHRTRMRVIRIAQAQRLRKDRPSSYMVLRGEPSLGQPLYIYSGVPLIACV